MGAAYALAKILYDKEGNPSDYLLAGANAAFAEILGLTGKSLVGQKGSELDIPWEAAGAEMMDAYAEAALRGKNREVRIFAAQRKCWFRVAVNASLKEYFILLVEEVTEEVQQQEAITARLTKAVQNQAALEDYIRSISDPVDALNMEKFLGTVLYKETRLQSLLNILEYEADSVQDFLDNTLNEVIGLTKSKIGFIYFYDEAEQELIVNTWSKDVLEDCRIFEPQTRLPLASAGLWGEAIRQRRPIIDNDYPQPGPLKKGYPAGHVQLYKFLATPVFYEGKIVALVGVANKETAYDTNDILNITLLMNSIWKTVEIRRMHTLISESEERFRLLFTNTTEGNALYRLLYREEGTVADFEILQVNLAYEDIFNLGKEETQAVAGKQRLEAYKQVQPPLLDVFSRVSAAGDAETFEIYLPLLKKYLAITIYQVQSGLLAGIFVDITENKRFEEMLYAEKEQLRITLQSIGDGVISTDQHGKVVLINRTAEILTGWPRKKAVGKSLREVFHIYDEETDSIMEDPIEKIMHTGKLLVKSQAILAASDGTRRMIETSASPIRAMSRDILGVVIVFRDVTMEKRHLAEIKFLSMHDKLTGLYNRAYFEEAMARIDMGGSLPLSVIVGDINGLKLTNDVFGHEGGDNLLKRVAQILKQSSNAGDIVARTGGDEFAILLPNSSHAKVFETVKRIRHNIARADIYPVKMSIALGSATKEKERDNFKLMFKRAEDRMYRRKLLESKSLRSSYISSLKETLFQKSDETHDHAERLKLNTRRIAMELGLMQNDMDDLELLSLLHDVGKIAVSDSILQKREKLSEEEWHEMKRHPEIGYRIASNISELSSIAEYILSHHERWDGSGYPQGLVREEIPLLSRVIFVADAYDAMTHDRAYRKALTHGEAMQEIVSNAGTQFDPEIVEVFCHIMK